MSAEQHDNAKCFCVFIEKEPVAFCSVIHFPHQNGGWWKEHRTVVLPDYQGIGIGNRLSEFVGSLFKSTGKPYRDVTAHPGAHLSPCQVAAVEGDKGDEPDASPIQEKQSEPRSGNREHGQFVKVHDEFRVRRPRST